MSKTAVATTDDTSTAVATLDPELAALIAQQEQEFDESLTQTPILKVGQQTTKEVREGDADAGDFINTLTSEGLGTKVGFVVSYYQQGRFAVDRDTNRAYVAFTKEIPEGWADFVGPEFVGTPFAEYPDAEEVFKHRVNVLKEIEWGSGPKIDTTHNFTGHVIVSGIEGEEDEFTPVRLSLKTTNMDAVRKWLTLRKSLGKSGQFWDKVFDLSTYSKEFTKGAAYLVAVKLGRATTADERSAAIALAQAVAAGRVADNQISQGLGDAPVEPDANGGLGV